MPTAENTIFISEAPPHLQPAGKRRRSEQLEEWARNRGSRADLLTVHDDLPTSSLLKRFFIAICEFPRMLSSSKGYDVVWVSGLGEVHMLVLAIGLSLGRRTVIYDACDSWVLQTMARSSLSLLKRVVPRVGLAIQRLGPRGLGVSYISARDAEADGRINRGRRVEIVPPAAPEILHGIDPPRPGKIISVVVAADLRSYHNRLGFEELMSAWPCVSKQFPLVSLRVFGQGLPVVDQHQIDICGWADDIRDVYNGQSAIYVTNRYGSGVPNKLIEAVAARRPIVIHSSLAPLVEPGPWVFPYDDDEPASVLCQLLSLEIQDDDAHYPRLR